MKSAVLARASGAARVVGFSIWHLREKSARPFYSETDDARRGDDGAAHVIDKNLHLLRRRSASSDERIAFPLADVSIAGARRGAARRSAAGRSRCSIPGAAWPNKRWPPERFGEVAAFLREVRGLPSVVLWGPGEEALAQRGRRAPRTARRAWRRRPAIADLVALVARGGADACRATPVRCTSPPPSGTPIVALFGPTDPRAQRAVGAGRRRRVALRVVRLPLRAALPRARAWCLDERQRRRGDRGDSAAARSRAGRSRGVMSDLARRARALPRARSASSSALRRAVAGASDAAQPGGRGGGRRRRRSAADLGGRASREGPRGHRVGPVSRSRGIRSISGRRSSASASRSRRPAWSSAVAGARRTWRHAHRGDPQRGSAPDREVRRRLSRLSGRAARRRRARGFSLERAMRNREYRAVLGLVAGACAARVEGSIIGCLGSALACRAAAGRDYNHVGRGRRADGGAYGRLAQW